MRIFSNFVVNTELKIMATFWTILGLSLIVVAICFIGLAIKILLKKNGKFPDIHIGHNKEMAKRNIHCVNTEDFLARRDYKRVDTSGYTKAPTPSSQDRR